MAVAPASARERLLGVHAEAAALLARAARADADADRARLLEEAARRVAVLAEEPRESSSGSGSLVPGSLRTELRQAADRLTAMARAAGGSSRPAGPAEISRFLQLLDRVRAQIDGATALGLELQGSYTRTDRKEAVAGGHASAMGPAPVPAAPGESIAPVRLVFEAREPPSVRTYAGGPTKDHILESAGNGLAVFDYDSDGLLDLYFVTAAQLTPDRQRIPHRNALYRNLGGWRFEDVSRRAGVDAAAWGSGACVGDVDGDARPDLYVTNWGPNLLFRNNGNGTFSEVAAAAGVQGGGWSTGCAFFDADADGDLDLYVARYVQTSWDSLLNARRTLRWRNGPRIMVGPAGLPPEPDLFFENTGSGAFVDATAARGFASAPASYGFAVLATDYDDDGDVDLFVANDSMPNFLFRNTGQGRFASVGVASGVGVNAQGRAQAGMGADAGDVDGDGRLDIVLTAFAHDTNTLYRNVSGREFEDASAASGLLAPTFVRMGWGVSLFDADLDGALDLFVANGHIFPEIERYPELGESFSQKNQLLLNRSAVFHDYSDRAGPGLAVSSVSRGAAVADLDNDGDPDVVVSNMDDLPTLLENRQTTAHHWVGLQVASREGNRLGIGARVTVAAGGRRQIREVRSGGSYLSQNDLRAFFGLGAHAGPVAVEVRLPGGRRWRWPALPVDRLHVLDLTDSVAVVESR